MPHRQGPLSFGRRWPEPWYWPGGGQDLLTDHDDVGVVGPVAIRSGGCNSTGGSISLTGTGGQGCGASGGGGRCVKGFVGGVAARRIRVLSVAQPSWLARVATVGTEVAHGLQSLGSRGPSRLLGGPSPCGWPMCFAACRRLALVAGQCGWPRSEPKRRTDRGPSDPVALSSSGTLSLR
jgi:hypothetical protein